MKVIVITGSVCTGKTTLAKKLSKKLNYKYIDVNKLITKNKLFSGYDKKRKCRIVDVKRLNKSLIKLINTYKKSIKNKSLNNFKKIKKGLIIDSHLSHYLPSKYVHLCIVTKCNLKVLEKRLKKRKYNKEKTKENLECEIFDICLNEAKENKHKILVIDTTQGINISKISRQLKR